MNAVLARSLVRLHAASWRRRYGVEYEFLLLEVPLSASAIANSVSSAVESRHVSERLLAIVPLVLLMATVLAAPLARAELGRNAKSVALRTVQHQDPLGARRHVYACYQAYLSPRKSLCA